MKRKRSAGTGSRVAVVATRLLMILTISDLMDSVVMLGVLLLEVFLEEGWRLVVVVLSRLTWTPCSL